MADTNTAVESTPSVVSNETSVVTDSKDSTSNQTKDKSKDDTLVPTKKKLMDIKNDNDNDLVKPKQVVNPDEPVLPPPQYLLDMLAAAKAERKAVRAERRAKRAEEEKRKHLEELRIKRSKAAVDAKLGLPPDLDESNIWLFEQIDKIYDYWYRSKLRRHYNKGIEKYRQNRYYVKRGLIKTDYRIRKFYRRYIGLSPAEKQRRQLNRDFKFAPKTNLAASYKMNLDELMYCNIFDRERSTFQTIRNRDALLHILNMPCVEGVASEVAFLLKADTMFLIEFVFRNHSFRKVTTYSFRVTKRTLLPALSNTALDSRLFYHNCRMEVPPRRHPTITQLLYRKMFGKPDNNEKDDDDDEKDKDDEDDKNDEGGENENENAVTDADAESGAGSASEQGDESVTTEGDGDGESNGGVDSLSQSVTSGNKSNKKDKKKKEKNDDDDELKKEAGAKDEDSDDDSVLSGDGSEAEALKLARDLAKSTVSDCYVLVKLWFENGDEINRDKYNKPKTWFQYFLSLGNLCIRNLKIAPEDDNEDNDDDEEHKENEDDENEEDEEEDEDEKKARERKEKIIKSLIKFKKFILCKNEFKEQLRANEQKVKEYREQERLRKEEENSKWFEDPTPTLFARNELRISGPNRHLSDVSDATVTRPEMKPFATCETGVSACSSYFYNEKDAQLDSED